MLVCRGHALSTPLGLGASGAACRTAPVLACPSACHPPTCLPVCPSGCLCACLCVTPPACIGLRSVYLCICFFFVCLPTVRSETVGGTERTCRVLRLNARTLSLSRAGALPCRNSPSPSALSPRPSDGPSANFRRGSCQSLRSPRQFTLTRCFPSLVCKALRVRTHTRTHAPVGAKLAGRVAGGWGGGTAGGGG